MSSDSELTDIEDDVPLSQGTSSATRSKGKSKGDAESNYKIRGALKVPRATTYTCQSLYEQISAQDIDLQPEYQRAVVWPDNKQIGLIDSIFRNFYVPPVIFVVQSSDDGGERRVCVDGKQRMTSIYRFIAGEIPYKDGFTGEKFVFKETGKIKAQLLPERYRKVFLNKQIVCMEYQDISPSNEREIFQRVQLGMALTPAERLQAVTGPQADFVRELLDKYVVDELANNISWDVSRANDFRGLATAVYAISRWPHLNTIPSLSVIETWLQDSDDLDEDFCEDVHDTFRIFCALAKDPKLSQPFRLAGVKKVAPVEFTSIAVLIHANKKKLSMAQLSEAIGLMRSDIRKNEKDIRQNSRTFKLILAFFKELKTSKLKPDNDPVAEGLHKPAKRKRTKSSPSEEYVPPAPALRPPASTAPQVSSAVGMSAPKPLPPPASAPPRAAPTEPSAMRIGHSMPPPHPSLPPPPPRQNSLGNLIMARMHPGPPPVAPNIHASRMYDPSRDPRRIVYQGQPNGNNHVGAPWPGR